MGMRVDHAPLAARNSRRCMRMVGYLWSCGRLLGEAQQARWIVTEDHFAFALGQARD